MLHLDVKLKIISHRFDSPCNKQSILISQLYFLEQKRGFVVLLSPVLPSRTLRGESVNVLLLGSLLGKALLSSPGIVLGTGLELDGPRLGALNVTLGGLLVQSVQSELHLVGGVRRRRGLTDILDGFLKASLNRIGHAEEENQKKRQFFLFVDFFATWFIMICISSFENIFLKVDVHQNNQPNDVGRNAGFHRSLLKTE